MTTYEFTLRDYRWSLRFVFQTYVTAFLCRVVDDKILDSDVLRRGHDGSWWQSIEGCQLDIDFSASVESLYKDTVKGFLL